MPSTYKIETFEDILKAFCENEFKPLKEKVDRIEGDGSVLKQDLEVLKHDREKKVVLVTEVSIKADRVDVERASERAKVIKKAMNLQAIPIVIGKEFTEGAEIRAKELEVIC